MLKGLLKAPSVFLLLFFVLVFFAIITTIMKKRGAQIDPENVHGVKELTSTYLAGEPLPFKPLSRNERGKRN